MLQFTKPFGSFSFVEEKPLGLFATVAAHTSVVSDLSSYSLLMDIEKVIIESKIGRGYVDLWKGYPEIEPIPKALHQATWFAFDLDDTLHEYRKASSLAMQVCTGSLLRWPRHDPKEFIMLDTRSISLNSQQSNFEHRQNSINIDLDLRDMSWRRVFGGSNFERGNSAKSVHRQSSPRSQRHSKYHSKT